MKRKLAFMLLAMMLLAPWPVAYAYDDAPAGQYPMQIETADASAAPKINACGNTIGGVTAGDLFYIDTGDSSFDIPVTLHITNADELVHCYRYLNLNVGVYVQTGENTWEKTTAANGEPLPDTYITMLNGQVNFMLPGYSRYKITIDKGCFYFYGNSGGAPTPSFYLTAG